MAPRFGSVSTVPNCALVVMLLRAVVAPLLAPVPATAHETLMVIGLEYSAWPDHHCVEAIDATLDAFAFPDAPLPPADQRASDIAHLMLNGAPGGPLPLWWPAHWNWRGAAIAEQLQELVGIIEATATYTTFGNTLYPDAIALLSLGVDPGWNGMGWRRQLAIEFANHYREAMPSAPPVAFLIEHDWHRPPSVFYDVCGQPYSQIWVPGNWHLLPADEAAAAVADAIRACRVVGTVGEARFVALEIDGLNRMTLELSAPIRHIQLWCGVDEPLSTWQDVASATFDLGAVPATASSIYWFAYGDSVGATWDWDTQTCREKEVFFTSPITRDGNVFRNQYAAEALAGQIPIQALMHQHTRISSDGQNAPTFEELMLECRTLGIDCVMTSDHDANPERLQGPLPAFIAAWDEVPATAHAPNSPPLDAVTLRAYPNPIASSGTVTIEYRVAQAVQPVLSLFDAQGRLVDRLAPTVRSDGRQREAIDLSGYPSGIYYVQLRAGDRSRTVSVVQIR